MSKPDPIFGDNNLQRLEDMGFSDLARATLLAAGIGTPELGECLRRAMDTMKDSLEATKINRISTSGGIEEFTDIDHNLRLKAASELSHLVMSVGGLRKQDQGKGDGGVNITLNVPFLQQLAEQEKDITPPPPSPAGG